ncbi:MAG: class I SAM-dependent methyltransferase, partial [Clostridiales bacterium]|nr:class I SAM-dependent methyltransferase [Clostridiales bacterium]
MNDTELKELLLADEHRAFSGWDFSSMDSRIQATPIPWNYEAIVRSHLRSDDKLLDMGTGGGEVLRTLSHPYENTTVTEAWEPNVKRCRERLGPLGIGVYQVYDDM